MLILKSGKHPYKLFLENSHSFRQQMINVINFLEDLLLKLAWLIASLCLPNFDEDMDTSV